MNNNHNDIDEKPTLRPIKEEVKDELQEDDDHTFYDLQYDEEVNRLLDEIKEEFFLFENSETLAEKEDFLEDNNHAEPKIPDGYEEVLNGKIKYVNEKLEKLSKQVCDACPSARDHIRRIEQDHSTIFCKMDDPRHPPLDKPWKNHWKFKTFIQCKKFNEPEHVHTIECDDMILRLKHDVGKVPKGTLNIYRFSFPKYVTDAVQFFQDFAMELHEKFPISSSTEAINTVSERNMWKKIKFEVMSNYLNETAIVIRGNGISTIIPHFKNFYQAHREKISNAVVVICYDTAWTEQKVTERLPIMPVVISGNLFLKDKVGPILVQHDLLRDFDPGFMRFNPVEIIQLSEVIQDYTGLTKETTLLHIGCNSGILCLTMAHKCGKIIGLCTEDVADAEKLKKSNKINNVSFIKCEPKKMLSTCSPLIRGHVAVAVLNLHSQYGNSCHVMRALRQIRSIWRVIIYGTFTESFHKNISVLTSEDRFMGERFLPMQGCILDKSPPSTSKITYELAIVFERKCLVQPKIDLLAPGPTLNLKVNSQVDCKSQSFQSLADNNEVEDMDISPLSENGNNIETPDQNSEDLNDKIARFSPILENVRTAEGFEFSITANATFFGLKVHETRIRVKSVEELMQIEELDKQIEEDMAVIVKNRELIRKYLQEKDERLNKNKRLDRSRSPSKSRSSA